MRKLLLLAAAVPLAVAPPAFAADHNAEHPSVCPVPEMRVVYDVETIAVHATLPVRGCAARENRRFTMTARVTRHNGDGSRDIAEWYEQCPSPAATDVDQSDAATQDRCDLDMAVFHPRHEDRVRYDVALTYPGAAAERTLTTSAVCSSDGEETSCNE